MKYFKYEPDLGVLATYGRHMDLPYTSNNGPRLLIVNDASDEEIVGGRMFTGMVRKLFDTCISRAKKWYPSLSGLEQYSWTVINFNATNSKEFDEQRLSMFIAKFDPDYIWVLNKSAFSFFKPYYAKGLSYLNTFGVPTTLTINDKPVVTTVIPNFNNNFVFKYGDKACQAYTLKYTVNCFANALNNDLLWDIGVKSDEIKSYYVDTIEKFDKLMLLLYAASKIAVDTETDSLERVNVRMVSIQFATSKKRGFFLPFYHFDTPFDVKELEYMRQRLHEFFSTTTALLIFQNPTFDLNVIRSNLKVLHFPFNVWDVASGEYAFDENLVVLTSVAGERKGYYSLFNMSYQYGFDGYVRPTSFKKEDRVFIKDLRLDVEGMIDYGVFDVVSVYGLHELQLARAAHFQMDHYYQFVAQQLSDTVHTFSIMNQIGNVVDKAHLWYMDSEDSPLRKELAEVEQYLISLPEVKEAERLIRIETKVPLNGLYGNIERRIFDLTKKRHVQILFFDVLGFDKVSIGADGSPNLDKFFIKKYGDSEVVKAYAKRNVLRALINNFVTGILKILTESVDARTDGRVRSYYGYLEIVTNRLNSIKPNLQNIPERTSYGKHIKRAFIAPPGHLIIKVDYSASEVRWAGISATDSEYGKSFDIGVQLRKRYLSEPTDENRFKMESIGDVHMMTADYFFDFGLSKAMTVDDLKAFKDFRQQIKNIVFGLIYGRTVKSIAGVIGRDVDYTNKLIKRFFAKYKATERFLTKTMESARKNLYVENQVGMRRNLPVYLMPDEWQPKGTLCNAADRRAVNSPIQGISSEANLAAMRLLECAVWDKFKHLPKMPITAFNTVHDSVFFYVEYPYLFDGLQMIKWAMTTGVMDHLKGFGPHVQFPIPIEIDFEVGPCLSVMKKFDGRLVDLWNICKSSLDWQNTELKYNVPVSPTMREIWGKQGEKICDAYRGQIPKYFNMRDAVKSLTTDTQLGWSNGN